MLESVIAGFLTLFRLEYFGMLMAGMLVGTAVGIIPGMGSSVGLAVCVPFLIYVEPNAAIAMMVGIMAVTGVLARADAPMSTFFLITVLNILSPQ